MRLGEHLAVVREQSARADGRAWLAELRSLVDDAVERWGLLLGEPFDGGSCAFVAPARFQDEDVVLKITLPHREARYEGDGLWVWDGDGCIRLVASSEDGFALLVERCAPGTMLRDDQPNEDGLRAAAEILRRLWARPLPADAPFELVADVCAEWSALTRQRFEEFPLGLDPGLVATGADLLETLPATATRRVLVHGDFNPGNILRAEREPWLAIDPKPMIGDPGYDVSPLAAQLGLPDDAGPDREILHRNFQLIADVTGEPVERSFAWATARTTESALWHASLGEDEQAIDTMRWARVFADLAGV